MAVRADTGSVGLDLMLRFFFFFFDRHVHFPFDLILLAVRTDVKSLTLDLALHFFSFDLILRMSSYLILRLSFDLILHLSFDLILNLSLDLILHVISDLILHRGVDIEVAFILLFFPDCRHLQTPSAMSSFTANKDRQIVPDPTNSTPPEQSAPLAPHFLPASPSPW
jgi:hypothetical protein